MVFISQLRTFMARVEDLSQSAQGRMLLTAITSGSDDVGGSLGSGVSASMVKSLLAEVCGILQCLEAVSGNNNAPNPTVTHFGTA